MPLSRAERARLSVALFAGRAAGLASRAVGRGSGASIRGQVIQRLDPRALEKLLQGRTVAAVSGTNGKTTTTHLLSAALRANLDDPGRLVTNADGANLHYGIASALGENPRADVAVLETDERVVADLVRLGRPKVLVLLNFSRDQLDRHHELKALGRSWRDALTKAGPTGPTVVANANDPLVVWAARAAGEVIWVDTGTGWTQDAALCPECGSVLTRSHGKWDCPGCELSQPEAEYTVADGRLTDAKGKDWPLQLQVPGAFNVANAACALAAAVSLGVPTERAIAGMQSVTSPAGRYATVNFGGSTARLLLAKNPAGWAEAIPLAQSDPVILAIDSAAADGRDVSWLWDVEYERLAGRHVIATGPRAQDLAVRLSYAEVEHTVVPDLAAALANHAVPVDVIATYTPFQRLRRLGGIA